MASIKRFEDLECWKTARQIVQLVYGFNRHGPAERDFGFRNQIQRAAVSIMSNIAEGFESRTQATFIDYLGHAKASAGEVRSQLYAALDLDYLEHNEFEELATLCKRCSSQIYGLIKYLKSKPNQHRISEDGAPYLISED